MTDELLCSALTMDGSSAPALSVMNFFKFGSSRCLEHAELAVQGLLFGNRLKQRAAKILVRNGIVKNAGLDLIAEIQTGNDQRRGIARENFRRFAGGAREWQNVNIRVALNEFDLEKSEKRLFHAERDADCLLNANAFYHSRLPAEPAARRQPALQRALQLQVMSFVENFLPILRDVQNRSRTGADGRALRVGGRFGLQREPVKRVRAERQKIRLVGDRRKFRAAKKLNGHQRLKRGQIQFNRLDEARQIGDDQDDFVLVTADAGENLPVFGMQKFNRAAAERVLPLVKRDQAPHPPEQRIMVALLHFDVDGFVVIFRVEVDRQVKALRIRAGKAGVFIRAPLHRRADAVAVAEINVFAHADFVAVINHRRSGQRQQQRA